MRLLLQRDTDIQSTWWAMQPHCTAKTGWITYEAAANADRRGHILITTCRLGIAVMNALAAVKTLTTITVVDIDD